MRTRTRQAATAEVINDDADRPRSETPEPDYTQKGEVKKKGKDNVAVYERYGLIKREQWADRKQLLKDGVLKAIENPSDEATAKTKSSEGRRQAAAKAKKRKGALSVSSKLRMQHIQTQVEALRSLVEEEGYQQLDPVVEGIERTLDGMPDLTAELEPDGILSSPGFLD